MTQASENSVMSASENYVMTAIDRVAQMNRTAAYRRILSAIDAAKDDMRTQYRREQLEKRCEAVVVQDSTGHHVSMTRNESANRLYQAVMTGGGNQ